ncbi:hypothetical protein RRG08_021247 [Elysia crispata]|uniref:Uncharacterized protein n=1 Tax=Elysia crispata TaxID=231223 RepID=A0AAE1D6M2_9GAST|nr:hypothetical protein RRG08_021247 [Elysia crispata]
MLQRSRGNKKKTFGNLIQECLVILTTFRSPLKRYVTDKGPGGLLAGFLKRYVTVKGPGGLLAGFLKRYKTDKGQRSCATACSTTVVWSSYISRRSRRSSSRISQALRDCQRSEVMRYYL